MKHWSVDKNVDSESDSPDYENLPTGTNDSDTDSADYENVPNGTAIKLQQQMNTRIANCPASVSGDSSHFTVDHHTSNKPSESFGNHRSDPCMDTTRNMTDNNVPAGMGQSKIWTQRSDRAANEYSFDADVELCAAHDHQPIYANCDQYGERIAHNICNTIIYQHKIGETDSSVDPLFHDEDFPVYGNLNHGYSCDPAMLAVGDSFNKQDNRIGPDGRITIDRNMEKLGLQQNISNHHESPETPPNHGRSYNHNPYLVVPPGNCPKLPPGYLSMNANTSKNAVEISNIADVQSRQNLNLVVPLTTHQTLPPGYLNMNENTSTPSSNSTVTFRHSDPVPRTMKSAVKMKPKHKSDVSIEYDGRADDMQTELSLPIRNPSLKSRKEKQGKIFSCFRFRSGHSKNRSDSIDKFTSRFSPT